MKVKVAVNGYGTIGKRVADAIRLQPDMELIGVSKTSPNYEAWSAVKKGIKLYVPDSELEKFKQVGVPVAGTIEEMFKQADIIVDATPNGVGAEYKPKYVKLGKKAIFQGGEKADVAEVSFSALCNYDEALNKNYVRVVSCNTTGMLRVLCTLNSKVAPVVKARGVVVRRAADPKEVKRGPINSIVLDSTSIPSHHAKDVQTVFKGLDIITMAVVVPTTLMHVHTMNVTLSGPVKREQVIDALRSTPRIVTVQSKKAGISSTAEAIEYVRDMGRYRNDLPEVLVFEDSVYVNNNELFLIYAVHQESIVVPENIDAIRAVKGLASAEESIKVTNATLQIMKGALVE
ncbi:MAG: type II glyceraldehyde-3-phosphate dehydrogenase [Thermoprotei archaeon]